MLDINYIREHVSDLQQNILNRQLDPEVYSVDKLLEFDVLRRDLQQKVDELREKRNEISKKIGQTKEVVLRQEMIEQSKQVKGELEKEEGRFEKVKQSWQALMDLMPNIVSEKMPVGKDEKGNVEIKSWGEKKEFDFEPKHHLEIGEALDLIDVKKSAQVSGSRFYYLKNEALTLEFGLFNYVFQKLVKKGFIPIETPVMVREKAMYGTGYFPSEKSQVYKLANEGQLEEKQDLYLTGTSEQAIVAYHMGDVFKENELPCKYVGYSPCFRSEVGSWGKDVRGIKRVHQFNKLEMMYFAKPEDSQKYMQEALGLEEEILQELKLPYHVIEMCTGDVGMATYRKWDVEVWLPSQKEYCETMSNSDLAQYHARRLNIKYEEEGQKDFVHTISATAITNTRIILAILDNYQDEKGRVRVPEILRDYVGKEWIEK